MTSQEDKPQTTWDEQPVSGEKPYVVCVVVWRQVPNGREFLVLHRRHAGGPDHEGDWAWTPPAGARQPQEETRDAAARELREETGLALDLVAAPRGVSPSNEVTLYLAKAPAEADVVLDQEHDRYAWLPLKDAARTCLPPQVGACILRAGAWLETCTHLVRVRPEQATDTSQGLPYFLGICETTSNARGLSLNVVIVAPGAAAEPHWHDGFETAIYQLEGRVETRYGPYLEHSVVTEAGDFLFIPPGVPHQALNLSTNERAVGVVARNDSSAQENVVLYGQPPSATS